MPMPRLRMLAFAAAFTAIAATAEAADPPVGDWVVTAIGETATTSGTEPTLTIGESEFNGYGGCNRFFGTLTLDAANITFGAAAATRMMCSDQSVMNQEQNLLESLAEVTTWQADGTELRLLDPNGLPIVVLAAAEKAPVSGVDVTIHVPDATTVDTSTARYTCGTEAVTVEYINAGTTSLAVVHLPDRTVVMSNVLAASGARYAGGQYIWWTAGSGVQLIDLTEGGEDAPTACTEVQ